MLRDGKFIKEDPPKIGSYYIAQTEREYSEEERLMQEVNLGGKPHKNFKEVDVIFWIIIFYSCLALLYSLIKR
jgi:hypothetical protein